MLGWLVSQVNWLTGVVTDTWDMIVRFISNPYPYIATLLDWVYNRAVSFVNAVKHEIADWTYGLYLNLLAWVNWFQNLYNTTIAPAIARIQDITNNLTALIGQTVQNWLSQALAWVYQQIDNLNVFGNWLYGLLQSARNEIINWTYGLFLGLLADVNWLKNNLTTFDPSLVYQKLGEILRYIADIDLVIAKTVLDSLLDWLEDKIGEALE